MPVSPSSKQNSGFLMGGYAAEILLYGQPSSGAENDLRQATEIRYRMVASSRNEATRIGPVFYEHRAEHPFLGQRLATDSGISDLTGARHNRRGDEKPPRRGLRRLKERLSARTGPVRPLVELLLVQETVERGELEKTLGSTSLVGAYA